LNDPGTNRDFGKVSSAATDSRILRGAYVHRRGEDAEDERRVAEFWRSSGLTVEALEDPKERFSRLPDFRLYTEGNPWAYCEVKTVWRHSWTVRILHEDRPVEERLEVSDKPVSERLSGDLVTAIRQLRSGNPDHALLNFVVLVNRDADASPALLSQLFAATPASLRGSLKDRRDARLAEELQGFRRNVDLCLWVNPAPEERLAVEACLLLNPALLSFAEEITGLRRDKVISLDPAA
jgi:hypothetical protein